MSILPMPRLMVAAPRKSSGKTMISIGLGAALRQRGYVVQPFKKGPDFIDPMWLSAACDRRCRNLDFFMMSKEGIEKQFLQHGQGADLCLVEGNMGLYDGLDADGSDSGMALVELLQLPVLLVVDCHGIARSAAPLIWGHLNFPGHQLPAAAIVLNNVSSSRQENKIRESLALCCPHVPVVGVLAKGDDLAIHERHLGLIPPSEAAQVATIVANIGQWVGRFLDLDTIVDLAHKAVGIDDKIEDLRLSSEVKSDNILTFSTQGKKKPFAADGVLLPGENAPHGQPFTQTHPFAAVGHSHANPPKSSQLILPGTGLRVAVATDQAFHFYYPENLEALAEQGITLVPCNLLEDARLPDVDGLFIGGGFPEVFLEKLSDNKSMLSWVRGAALEGLPIYAECGGLMYLSRFIRWHDGQAAMSGVLPFGVEMRRRPVGYGYMEIETSGLLPWPAAGQRVRCHEFHYSAITEQGQGLAYAYRVLRGHGVDGQFDGVLHNNVLASYAHIHVLGALGWADFLTEFWRRGGKIIA